MKKVGIVLGTRPEAIKLAPFLSPPSGVQVVVCSTGQHRELLDPMLAFFGYTGIHRLEACVPGQSLSALSARMLPGLRAWLLSEKPDLVFVQGDTQTAFIGALAAFYEKIPVAHIEAGLRTSDPYNPFPEEMNRRLVGQMATYHFAPTQTALQNLIREGFGSKVWCVGNTGIDALYTTLKKAKQPESVCLDVSKKCIFVTAHRRENHGEPLLRICQSLQRIVHVCPDVEIVFPVHKNPQVWDTVHRLLGQTDRIVLTPPLAYPETVWMLSRSEVILTDSGGLQEEAPALRKPVLVMREETERVEGVACGASRLVGTDPDVIVGAVLSLLRDPLEYAAMANAGCPYGQGDAASQIWTLLLDA